MNPYSSVESLCWKLLLITILHVGLVGAKGEVIVNGTAKTSIVRLLSHPELYDGKRIEIMGYYISGFEYSGVFLTKEAAQTANVALGIWVDVPERRTNSIDAVKANYVVVRGTFKQGASGHGGMWQAEISPVEMLWRVKRTTNVLWAALPFIGITMIGAALLLKQPSFNKLKRLIMCVVGCGCLLVFVLEKLGVWEYLYVF